MPRLNDKNNTESTEHRGLPVVAVFHSKTADHDCRLDKHTTNTAAAKDVCRYDPECTTILLPTSIAPYARMPEER